MQHSTKGENRSVGQNAPRSSKTRFRISRLLLLGICAGVLGAFAIGQAFHNAWQETARREAFLPELELEARRNPGDGRLMALLGARYAEAHDYTGTGSALSAAANAGEQNEAVWLTWAAGRAAEGDPQHAIAVLRLGLGNTTVAPFLQEALQRVENLGATPSPVSLAITICPKGTHWLAARYTAGSFLNGFFEWRGKRDPAHSGFATRERWAANSPDDPQAQRLWGEALIANRLYADADTVLHRALKLSPNSPATHLALAQALEGEGAPGKAGVEYIACLKSEPNNLTALMGLGKVALAKKLLLIGVDVYERAAKLAPQNAEVWIGLGNAHYNQRLNLGRAQEAFATATRLAPDRTDYFIVYSNTLRALSHNDEAETLLRRYVAKSPEDGKGHYLLGLLLLDHNASPEHEKEAEAQLRESLRLQPDVATAEARLGRLYLDRGRVQEAIPLLQTAIRHDTYDLEATLSLARAYRQAGRTQEAQAAQESAAALADYRQKVAFLEDQVHRQPDNLKTGQQLAAVYRQGGETDKAQRQEEMNYVLKTHPQQATRGLRSVQRATSLSVPSTDSADPSAAGSHR